jgi:gag-polyprotein putative aspartyl protease
VEINDKIVAVRCNTVINDIPIKAIIDTGAATNIVTTTLLNILKISIHRSSETRFIIANGTKQASLGKSDIEIELGDWIIPVEVEIIDSNKKEILLGTKFLSELKGNIDLKDKTLTLRVNDEITKIPIWYTQKEIPLENIPTESSDSENSVEYEDSNDELEVQLVYELCNSDNEDSEDNDVKEIVLG